MKNIKAIAIDDEPMALEVVSAHTSKVPYIDLKRTFFSARAAGDTRYVDDGLSQ